MSQELPKGAAVASGQVGISSSGAHMQITQSTDRAVVNWDAFSVDTNSSVAIRQPGKSSRILNRVTGPMPSRIDGSLSANGQVFLVNRGGIVIGPSGRVDAAGFVASTLNIRDEDFLNDRLRFEGQGASGSVRNEGVISIGPGGYAALLGGQVSNSGVIDVPLGFVGLGSGGRATLDFSEDGFLQVDMPMAVGGDGPLVENSGTIRANGGRVEMKVAAAREAVRNTVNLSGYVEARSVGGRSGHIVLGGGGGRVTVSGRVTTSPLIVENSKRPVERPKGGDITITGHEIVLAGAEIDASGPGGGGTVRIGGNYRGEGPLPNAWVTAADADTHIDVSSTDTGDGGTAILWSDGGTSFSGTIAARGGPLGGDGGFVEVSGKQQLYYSGLVDTRAPAGEVGTLLLDPFDIEITDGATTNSNFDPGSISALWIPTASGSTINNAVLSRQLEESDVVVSTANSAGSEPGTITVSAPLTWASASDLRFSTVGDVVLNQPITAQAGSFTLAINGQATTGPLGEVDVAQFRMDAGSSWVQNGTNLPAFNADDFGFSEGASFRRVSGGDGSAANPFQIFDVYGLQGLDSADSAAANFVLTDRIDASGTANWNPVGGGVSSIRFFAGFDPIGSESFTFSGEFDGAGHEIDGLTVNRVGERYAALFRALGTGGGAADVHDFSITNVNITSGHYAGAVAGVLSFGEISDVSASGDVSGQFAGMIVGENFAGNITRVSSSGSVTGRYLGNAGFIAGPVVGGIAGNTASTITDATTDADVTAIGSASSQIVLAGGAVGFITNRGNEITGRLERIRTDGSVTLEDFAQSDDVFINVRAGGIAGDSLGDLVDIVSHTSISDNVTAPFVFKSIGGLAGGSSGEVRNGLATGTISGEAGAGEIDALIASRAPAASGLFWDANTVSELADSSFGTALETSDLQDTEVFAGRAEAVGWDLATVWAPGEPGRYPTLYALSPVLYAVAEDNQGVYGDTDGLVLNGQVFGGPHLYVFGSNTDTLDTSGIFQFAGAAPGNVGDYLVTTPDEVVSDEGEVFTVVTSTGTFTVTPAGAITVTALDQSETYGQAFNFPAGGASADFVTVGGLVNGDTLQSAVLSSDGSPADADVGDYAIEVANAVIDGFGDPATPNYEGINYVFGTLTKTPAFVSVTVTADDQTKTYSTPFTFDGTEFSSTNLLFDDRIDSVTLASAGAAANAGVGTYAIVASDALGEGLDNYNIIYADGLMTVQAFGVVVVPDDQTKTFGTPFSFEGTEFSPMVLPFGARIDFVTLESDGAVADAAVGSYAISASDATGVGLENFDISYDEAMMTVDPFAVVVIPDDQTKTYGQPFSFDGTEFTPRDLLFGDSILTVTLQSDATASTANVGSYTIGASDAVGVGLENYNISYDVGEFSVSRAGPIVVTALDQGKQFGTTFTFQGTEFSTQGMFFNGDAIASVTLQSAATDLLAPAAAVPYPIFASDAVGQGLGNYAIEYRNGNFVVFGIESQNIQRQISRVEIPNFDDFIGGDGSFAPAFGEVAPELVVAAAASNVELALISLQIIEESGAEFEAEVSACRQTEAVVDDLIGCISAAMLRYQAALDPSEIDLPEPLQRVVAAIVDARTRIDDARAAAQSRLRSATTDAERRAIEREALDDSIAALAVLRARVEQEISLLRPDESELSQIHAAQGNAILRTVSAVVEELQLVQIEVPSDL